VPSELDRIVERVITAHPSCGSLTDLLAINGYAPDAYAALEQFIASRDRTLVVRLHRAYGTPLPTPSSLGRAIGAIGFRPVHSAAIAVQVIRTLRSEPTRRLSTSVFWRNAIAVGLLSIISAAVEGVHSDEAFAAGLLHRLGLLLLDQHAPAAFSSAVDLAAHEDISIDDAVAEALGLSPAELAGAVALRWNLPTWLVESCAYPAPVVVALDQPRKLESLVLRARMAAVVRGFGDEFTHRDTPESRATWLVERPLLALDGLGGQAWLDPRVDALLSISLLDE
jgi:hypothetical protein